jgi:hypothetical protein
VEVVIPYPRQCGTLSKLLLHNVKSVDYTIRTLSVHHGRLLILGRRPVRSIPSDSTGPDTLVSPKSHCVGGSSDRRGPLAQSREPAFMVVLYRADQGQIGEARTTQRLATVARGAAIRSPIFASVERRTTATRLYLRTSFSGISNEFQAMEIVYPHSTSICPWGPYDRCEKGSTTASQAWSGVQDECQRIIGRSG